MIREWSILIYYIKNVLFGHISKKISTFTFGAWSFFLVHIQFTPSVGPIGFVDLFFKKTYYESWTPMKKGHPPWSDFMVHVVNRPLMEMTFVYI